MPLVVDTYNVLHISGVLPVEMAGIDTAELMDLISDSRYSAHAVALVCDGRPQDDAPEEGEYGSLRVVYAGAGGSADDVIIAMIRQSSAPRNLTVVTMDREIEQAARRRGCRMLRSDVFLQRIAHDAQKRRRRSARPVRKPSGPLAPGEVDAWLRIFGLSDRDLTYARPGESRSDEGAEHAPPAPSQSSTPPPPRASDGAGIDLDRYFDEDRRGGL